MPNKEAIAKTLSLVINNQKKWEQESWVGDELVEEIAYGLKPQDVSTIDLDSFLKEDENVCGTSACIAGWATLAAGYKIAVKNNSDYDKEFQEGAYSFWPVPPGKDPRALSLLSFSEAAQDILGLTSNQQHEIFMEMNHTVAIARLYSLYKVDTTFLHGAYFQLFGEEPPLNYLDLHDTDSPAYHDVAKALFDKCSEEFYEEKTNA